MRRGREYKLCSNVKNQRLAKDLADFDLNFHSYSTFEAHLELHSGHQRQDLDVLVLQITQLQL